MTRCVICGEPASGRHSLPVNNNADVVPVSYQGEWAAVASCESCHALHAAAGDRCNEVLDAYVKASSDMRVNLGLLRDQMQKLADSAREAYEASL